eukprot:CAMPEP_0115085228 /NCGR_PEP_ID=MMETSP0227-20121206/21796_1 /TAXON_ID=89957 /ORGANISM="Polarella glacialis, Strain CCMP 1383" /LENGTH=159 /DNA_ID=CAMNT_0002474317 /DNA_START=728 /DNA_END=1204 /DNA_ORIENTATION=+
MPGGNSQDAPDEPKEEDEDAHINSGNSGAELRPGGPANQLDPQGDAQGASAAATPAEPLGIVNAHLSSGSGSCGGCSSVCCGPVPSGTPFGAPDTSVTADATADSSTASTDVKADGSGPSARGTAGGMASRALAPAHMWGVVDARALPSPLGLPKPLIL